MSLFAPKADPRRLTAIRMLKELARELFEATEHDGVSVVELACSEPGCPPLETVVAVLRPGSEPRQVKVHKAAVDVTEADLRAALSQAPHGHSHGPSAPAAAAPGEQASARSHPAT